MGDVEVVDGTLRITRIRVVYHLTVPEGKRDVARRVFGMHAEKCPVHQTLAPCVDFDLEIEIEEA
ncbi:MAG: hypothetical protein ACOC83_04485 [Gemmatimonadota bacterium]